MSIRFRRMLSYGGGSQEKEVRLESVKRNVRSVQLLVESEKLKELLDSLDEAEKRAYEAIEAFGPATLLSGVEEGCLVEEAGRL